MAASSQRLNLKELPLVARMVISAFLVSVGFGYFSALVQLHFQQAAPGKPLPGPDELVGTYSGKPGVSTLERLVTAGEHLPFNGSGSMRSAFTFRSSGWGNQIDKFAADNYYWPWLANQAEKDLVKQRENEVLLLVDWIHDGTKNGYSKETYAKFPLKDELASLPVDGQFIIDADGKKYGNIQRIINVRCVRCHEDGKPGAEGQIHLETLESMRHYLMPERGGGMALKKLAQSTHVHLLGFSMLYGLTGLIFAFTSYPRWARLVFAPLALLAQVVEIACWWLARANSNYALLIPLFGGVVAVTVGVQIIGSLFNMYGKRGRILLLALLLAVGVGGAVLYQVVIKDFLKREAQTSLVS